MNPVPCKACGDTNATMRWHQFSDGSVHIEERCARCNAFRQFAPQTDENVAMTLPEIDSDDGQIPLFGDGK